MYSLLIKNQMVNFKPKTYDFSHFEICEASVVGALKQPHIKIFFRCGETQFEPMIFQFQTKDERDKVVERLTNFLYGER